MYIINALVPFNILIDTDMGILKLIDYEYHNEDFFLPGILNTSETNQRYFLATRNISNVVEALLSVEDKELAEDLYRQFMEKEYDQILKLSCNTAICDLTLLLKKNMNQVIRVTVLCEDEKQKKLIEDRRISVFRIIVDKPEDMSLKNYGTIFVKDVKDLDRYRIVEGKTIYVPSYGFNVTVDPELPTPLLPEDTLLRYGKSNEFQVYSPYVFDPRSAPVV